MAQRDMTGCCGKGKVTAVVVDNGEELFEQSLNSLIDQTLRPYIIVASGPKTDMELAESLADEVMEPVEGMGRARVNAILASYQDYVFSCDSDTIYAPSYVEEGVRFLNTAPFGFVKAGCINPLSDIPDIYAIAEAWVSSLIWPYEFSLAFKRQAFLDLNLHRKRYDGRLDIGHYIPLSMVPSNLFMMCWTRLPTWFVEREVKNKFIFGEVKI